MSAFMVSKTHIDYIVTAAVSSKLIPACMADEAGRMLWRENLRSVAYRYPNDKDGGRPGPISFRDSHVDTYTWKETAVITGGALRKTIGCLAYQSCEHREWEESNAYKFLEALKPAGAEWEGYDEETPWGWNDEPFDGEAELADINREMIREYLK